MRTIEHRLAALEATRPKQTPKDKQRAALNDALDQCYSVLSNAFASDQPALVCTTPYAYRADYTGCLSSSEKIAALAERINNGHLTPDDLDMLNQMPTEALAVLGMSAAEYILWNRELMESI